MDPFHPTAFKPRADSLTTEQLNDLEEASQLGDLTTIHRIYSIWFANQIPNPVTGLVEKDVFYMAALRAATNNQSASLAYLLLQGVAFDRNIIEVAVLSKSTDTLQVLLDHGWNINEPEAYCEPPFLGLAVRDESLVRWFLNHGANPNAQAGEWDVTPLSSAAAVTPLSTIKLLFDHGGSIAQGQLLHHASDRTDPACVPILEYLVEQGAPINQTLWEDRPDLADWANLGASTPLYNAVAAENIESVRFLLRHGADRHKPTVNSGRLPIDVAQARKYTEIVKLLADEPISC